MSATRRSSLSTSAWSKNPWAEGSNTVPRLLDLAQRVEALLEAAGVGLLGARQRLEPLGNLGEALLAGGAGEAGIHLCVLVRLALDRRLEVQVGASERESRDRVADVLEEIEVPEGVAGPRLGRGADSAPPA